MSNKSDTSETMSTLKQCVNNLKPNHNLTDHSVEHSDFMSYTCNICPKKFQLPRQLRNHRLVHLKPIGCKQCPLKFRDKTALRSHIASHSDKRPHPCTQCPKKFKTKQVLKNHTATVHWRGTPNFPCTKCTAKFKSKLSLRQHSSVHSSERPFACDICGGKFKRKNLLQQHQVVHTDKKPFKCTKCSYASKTKVLLKQHLFLHTGEKPFICSYCDRKFAFKVGLQRHAAIHSREGYLDCPSCPSHFPTQQLLKEHVYMHSQERQYSCKICGFETTKRSALEIHCRIHTGERPYECELCSTSFADASHLREHKKHIHENSNMKKFSCPFCQYASNDKNDSLGHLRSTHAHLPDLQLRTSVHKYGSDECMYCGLKMEQNQREHMLMHANETTVNCKHCCIELGDKHLLNSHLCSENKSELPYICQICDKSYDELGTMWKHIEKHRTSESANFFNGITKELRVSLVRI